MFSSLDTARTSTGVVRGGGYPGDLSFIEKNSAFTQFRYASDSLSPLLVNKSRQISRIFTIEVSVASSGSRMSPGGVHDSPRVSGFTQGQPPFPGITRRAGRDLSHAEPEVAGPN